MTVTLLPLVEAVSPSPTKSILLNSVVKLLPSSFTVILAGTFDNPLPSPLKVVASTRPKEPVEDIEPLTPPPTSLIKLPLNTNILNITIMANNMPFIGRG